MRVIGTAGHVDHGKSTLVRALTGIDPDRLKEEREREMTIDLGFAWLSLPGGEVVSLVDVPGHEAFIKNMLAGVGGLDAAMLVIAADEGIMPQTREHLAILNLLRVKTGVVALTKIDLAEDEEWAMLVQSDIRKELIGTFLENARIVPVSARRRTGLEELKEELRRVLGSVELRRNLGRPRLPIDRVFSMSGFGTVVTGTLIDGIFRTGDEVEILPGGKHGRVRGLQRHQAQVDLVEPGTRLAMNLSGITKEELERGNTVVRPGMFQTTCLVDVHLEWLAGLPRSLKHNEQLDFYCLAQQAPARVRLLQGEEIKPGNSGWAQLMLGRESVVAKGDRFVLRVPSPSLTVGGGLIASAHPAGRHRRGRPEVIKSLETSASGTPEELLLQFLSGRLVEPVRELPTASGLSGTEVAAALDRLASVGEVIRLGRGGESVITVPNWLSLVERSRRFVEDYHLDLPFRAGIPREELKNRLGLPGRSFDLLLERASTEQILEEYQAVVRRPGFQPRFPPELGQRVEEILEEYRRAPFASPTAQETEEKLGSEALNALLAQGKLVRLNEQVLFAPEPLDHVIRWVRTHLQANPQLTAAELRDQFGTSRKYAIALLEYLDVRRITRRVGDARVLR